VVALWKATKERKRELPLLLPAEAQEGNEEEGVQERMFVPDCPKEGGRGGRRKGSLACSLLAARANVGGGGERKKRRKRGGQVLVVSLLTLLMGGGEFSRIH